MSLFASIKIIRTQIVAISRPALTFWRMSGIWDLHEFVDAVPGQIAKHEEPAIGGNDVALLKATIVPDRLRSDALGLDSGGRLFLDPAVLLGRRAGKQAAGSRSQAMIYRVQSADPTPQSSERGFLDGRRRVPQEKKSRPKAALLNQIR
jgi:hypothetical protein